MGGGLHVPNRRVVTMHSHDRLFNNGLVTSHLELNITINLKTALN